MCPRCQRLHFCDGGGGSLLSKVVFLFDRKEEWDDGGGVVSLELGLLCGLELDDGGGSSSTAFSSDCNEELDDSGGVTSYSVNFSVPLPSSNACCSASVVYATVKGGISLLFLMDLSYSWCNTSSCSQNRISASSWSILSISSRMPLLEVEWVM